MIIGAMLGYLACLVGWIILEAFTPNVLYEHRMPYLFGGFICVGALIDRYLV